MSARRFVDSNVVVYAYDRSAPGKQAVAQDLLKQGVLDAGIVISVQVLGEFFNAVTRRIEKPMTADEAREAVDRIKVIPVTDLDLQLVERAIDTHQQYHISYWDSMIVASAEKAGCTEILSEDLNEGQSYHGITVVNPFALC